MNVVNEANKKDEKFLYQKHREPPFRMGIPASVVSGVQLIAQDEMRDDKFAVWSIKRSPEDMRDFRLLEIALPGVHADIGGSYKTGPSKMYQYFSKHKTSFIEKANFLPTCPLIKEWGLAETRSRSIRLLCLLQTPSTQSQTPSPNPFQSCRAMPNPYSTAILNFIATYPQSIHKTDRLTFSNLGIN